MTSCPRCKAALAVRTDRDMFGEYSTCLTCGWGGETGSVEDADERTKSIVAAEKLVRHKFNTDPAKWAEGAPKPDRNDFIMRAEYSQVYAKWYWRNVKKEVS